MNAQCVALRSDPPVGGLGVSSMAHMFFGTIAGVASIAADAPGAPLKTSRVRQKLEGMESILQPQVEMMEKIISHVRSMRNFGTADYIDPDGEIEDVASECVSRLQTFVETLTRGDENLKSTVGVDPKQRIQLHETYVHIIALAQQAIELIQTLAGAIVTHDINAEPTGTQSWERLDDMLSDLKAQPA